MPDWLDTLDSSECLAVRRSPPPDGSSAMRATLTKERFSDPQWIFERKLDGIRCVAVRASGESVRLLSRNNLSLNERYPELVSALEAERGERFAADGEVVAFEGSSTSFARLAQRGRHYVRVFYYVFDLLWLDGYDIRALPLRTRKRLLRRTLAFNGPVRLTPHRNESGEQFFAYACSHGWEGLIAKRADSRYSDTRSRDWLKFKCEQGQELVIGGYTAPHGSREEFGALLLGYFKEGQLRYAGKVGTGFDHDLLVSLGRQLRAMQVQKSPFVDAAAIRERGVSWVTPSLVAQIGFTEWTSAGRLRHPRFLGLRDDKPAEEVVRE